MSIEIKSLKCKRVYVASKQGHTLPLTKAHDPRRCGMIDGLKLLQGTGNKKSLNKMKKVEKITI